jgi:hypothetical protein
MRYFHNWMAHIIQRPWEKTGVAVILYSLPGAGKSEVINFFREHVFGPEISFMVEGMSKLTGQFNSLQQGKVFASVEEQDSVKDHFRAGESPRYVAYVCNMHEIDRYITLDLTRRWHPPTPKTDFQKFKALVTEH